MTTKLAEQFADEIGCRPTIERAISFDPKHLVRIWEVPVSWNFALKTSAGCASLRDGIELHPGLLQATLDDLRETFLHECAHMMEVFIYRKMGHGREWWEAMIRLGEKPWITRRHNIASCGRERHNVVPSIDELFGSQAG